MTSRYNDLWLLALLKECGTGFDFAKNIRSLQRVSQEVHHLALLKECGTEFDLPKVYALSGKSPAGCTISHS